jgi:hypothetical protein
LSPKLFKIKRLSCIDNNTLIFYDSSKLNEHPMP